MDEAHCGSCRRTWLFREFCTALLHQVYCVSFRYWSAPSSPLYGLAQNPVMGKWIKYLFRSCVCLIGRLYVERPGSRNQYLSAPSSQLSFVFFTSSSSLKPHAASHCTAAPLQPLSLCSSSSLFFLLPFTPRFYGLLSFRLLSIVFLLNLASLSAVYWSPSLPHTVNRRHSCSIAPYRLTARLDGSLFPKIY